VSLSSLLRPWIAALLAGCGPASSNDRDVSRGSTESNSSGGSSETGEGSGICGDGLTQREVEQCEDGNTQPGDGCSPSCQHEALLSAGGWHTCARLETGGVRCWGRADMGQLGYGNVDDIGDDETPASAGDVDVEGPVAEVDAGFRHTCVRLQAGALRCWGFGNSGQLGYANTNDIGDDETPAVAGGVDVGGAVVELAAGFRRTCGRLDTGSVRCWGDGAFGQLGYGDTVNIGDDEAPVSAGDVDLGGPVVELAGGATHNCALIETGAVRCWGNGEFGRLGYGNTNHIGDDETPAAAGDVNVGGIVVELAAGGFHTCARLDSGAVRCWGQAASGQLGYGNTNDIGDDETPASAGDVDVGGNAVEIAAGHSHTCARLDSGTVRCWGKGSYAQLGYGNTNDVGDDEAPAAAGDVDIGSAVSAITAGDHHTCVRLVSGAVRCWGWGDYGLLGYGNTESIGDDEFPAAVGDIPL